MSKKCKKNMTVENCEQYLASQTMKTALYLKGRAQTSSELFYRLTKICEAFIRDNQVVIYGGTAINALLPEEDKFYDPVTDVPDYDVYSPIPMKHAKEVVDIFVKNGFEHVEAKSGVHYGTYKVYVNFTAALDITYMPPKLFKMVEKDAIIQDGMLYANPALLRQGMYKELSEPMGDVERWKKVVPRLQKLNKAYPIKAENCAEVFEPKTDVVPMDKALKELVETILVEQRVVFLGGGLGNALYAAEMDPPMKLEDAPYYEAIATSPLQTFHVLQKTLEREGYSPITAVKHEEIHEMVGYHYEVKWKKNTIALLFVPLRCYAYNEVVRKGVTYRVGSFDTLLSFYFAYLYVKRPYLNKKRITCMADMLFKVQQQNYNNVKGLLNRYPLTCYGKEVTLQTIRAKKAQMRKKLKRGTKAYRRWFFNYHPVT